jgi:hypothetical protein
MPYKDHEKSRSYQREYKRRQRAKAKMSNPMCPTMLISMEASQTLSQTVKRKAYICAKVPHYRLPGIAFKYGIFVEAYLSQISRKNKRELNQTRFTERKFSAGSLSRNLRK